LVALSLMVTAIAPASAHAGQSRPLVMAITLNTEINPVSASFVSDSIDKAESSHASALVIEMDTPGGLDTSMDDIIHDVLAARLPVIVYVSPQGGRAASAGSIITMASDYAAMAPNTEIGAATPIDSSGSNIGSDLRRKIINDAAAKVRGLAESHGRNAGAAVLMVTKGASYPVGKAVEINLVERESPSLHALLQKIDGMGTRGDKHLVMHTANAQVEHLGMPFTLRLLNILIDPNLLYLLFLGGIAGLAYEVFHPGVILPGTLGAVSLLLALFGFSIVPVNWAGAALIVLGVALLIAEAFVTSHGLIAISGIIALCVGGLMLFRTPGSEMGVSPFVVITVAVLLGSGMAFVLTKVIAARHQPVTAVGLSTMVGREAVVRTPLRPLGEVYVEGALWQAQTDDGSAEVGDTVIVRDVEGLLLHVEPAPAGTPTAQEAMS
jgi:membrane-bound serine protease (ClpP class)